jgi:AraC-like DNA-binding protein
MIGQAPTGSVGRHTSQGKLRLRTASNACMLRSATVNRPGTNGSYISSANDTSLQHRTAVVRPLIGYAESRMILSRHPCARLSAAIESIWHYESSDTEVHGRERVLPDGRFQVALNLSGRAAAVSGLRSHHVVIDTARLSHVMGVVFRPAGARAFFEEPALDFYNRSVPLALVWGPKANHLVDRLRSEPSAPRRLAILEASLVEISSRRDSRRLTVHPAVTYALREFRNSPHIKTVSEVSREIGWSRRWFCQAFGEAVGMTPKRYCRLLRFQKVVRQIAAGRRVAWADLATSAGFVDQAHLAHEFRAFSGLSPERFLAAERPYPNHVRLD